MKLLLLISLIAFGVQAASIFDEVSEVNSNVTVCDKTESFSVITYYSGSQLCSPYVTLSGNNQRENNITTDILTITFPETAHFTVPRLACDSAILGTGGISIEEYTS